MSEGIGAAFSAVTRGQAALSFTTVARDFKASPGGLSGLRLVDTIVEIAGIERISGQLAKYAFKLATRSDQASLHAAQEMVELMRSRVPEDTGLLLNGITYRREGGSYIVEATADRGGYDYALAVEAGHHAGGTAADADLFQDTTGRGFTPSVRSRGGESDVPGQPYFYNSAREALSDWGREVRSEASAGAREAGL